MSAGTAPAARGGLAVNVWATGAVHRRPMDKQPLRSVILGYSLAALGGCALAALGVGVIASVVTAWLGGAILTLGVAAITVRRSLVTGEWPGIDDDATQDSAAEDADLARWEADHADEARATRASGPRRRA
jgi:hypothetical protein